MKNETLGAIMSKSLSKIQIETIFAELKSCAIDVDRFDYELIFEEDGEKFGFLAFCRVWCRKKQYKDFGLHKVIIYRDGEDLSIVEEKVALEALRIFPELFQLGDK